MKRLIFIIFSLFLFSTINAQVMVNGVDINKAKNVEYCELLGTAKLLSNKVTVAIDYGQARKLFKSQAIKDKNGKPVVFNSMIEALNFMESNGWEYVNSYAITIQGTNVYHWLLKKKGE